MANYNQSGSGRANNVRILVIIIHSFRNIQVGKLF